MNLRVSINSIRQESRDLTESPDRGWLKRKLKLFQDDVYYYEWFL
uniref:Uncharacterized protein n=1 Tax=Tetranychus urticae TaxID=32264 RepID=T1KQ92_TETUR